MYLGLFHWWLFNILTLRFEFLQQMNISIQSLWFLIICIGIGPEKATLVVYQYKEIVVLSADKRPFILKPAPLQNILRFGLQVTEQYEYVSSQWSCLTWSQFTKWSQ